MTTDLRYTAGWLLVCALALGAAGGWALGRMPLHTQLANLRSAHATERAAQADAVATALAQAQTRGDALSAGLLTQQNNINRLKQEKTRAITQATTGSACLSEPALRLLHTAPGLAVAGLPPATGGTVAEGGAVASDTDLTGWAIDTGAAYEVCRARLDALITWHTATPDQPATKPVAP